jgi:predicted metal-binding membrane protein
LLLDRAVETALRRDRVAVLMSLVGVTLLAWGYLLWDASQMAAMDMAMPEAGGPAMGLLTFSAAFLMWTVMMVGMMLPSAAPTILLYAGIVRKNREQGRIFPAVSIFAAGYLVTWAAFSAIAAAAQVLLGQAALLSPMMVSTSATLSGLLLIVAGIYQWLPIKDACLRICRSPFAFVTMRWRDGRSGAFGMGLENGAICVSCCWSLMLLLFVAGVMNLVWVAAIAGFIFVEKLLPAGRLSARFAGVGLISLGIWKLALDSMI